MRKRRRGGETARRGNVVRSRGGLFLLVCLAYGIPLCARDYRFDGTISRPVLENYLSRSITFAELLNRERVENALGGNTGDNIRMLTDTGAKFVGRAIYMWGGEGRLPGLLERGKPVAARLHAADPDIVIQGAAFEIVSDQVNSLPVPGWIWGYDEICWFAHQPEGYRNRWLRYAWGWIRKTDPQGYLQMPGSRPLADPVNGKNWYWANTRSDNVPTGFNQEQTIKQIWAGDR